MRRSLNSLAGSCPSRFSLDHRSDFNDTGDVSPRSNIDLDVRHVDSENGKVVLVKSGTVFLDLSVSSRSETTRSILFSGRILLTPNISPTLMIPIPRHSMYPWFNSALEAISSRSSSNRIRVKSSATILCPRSIRARAFAFADPARSSDQGPHSFNIHHRAVFRGGGREGGV